MEFYKLLKVQSFVLFIFYGVVPWPVHGFDPEPSMEGFRDYIQDGFEGEVPPRNFKLEVGQRAFLPVSWLRSGQAYFSLDVVVSNIQELVRKYDEKTKQLEPEISKGKLRKRHEGRHKRRAHRAYDEGRSIYKLETKHVLYVVRGPHGFTVVDGHHKLMTSLYLGAETIPVKLLEDWSDLSETDFEARLRRENLVFPYDLNGSPIKGFPSITELEDSPYYFVARQLVKKVKVDLRDGEPKPLRILHQQSNDWAIFIKTHGAPAFLEAYIAIVLARRNLAYDYKRLRVPPENFLREARRALRAAQGSGRFQIFHEVPHLEVGGPMEDDDLLKLLTSHFIEKKILIACEKHLL